MRSSASWALGFLLILAGSACGSDTGNSSSPGAPPFSGPLPTAPASSGSEQAQNTATAPSQDSVGSASGAPAAETSASGTGASNEGAPDVTQLAPEQSQPSGSGSSMPASDGMPASAGMQATDGTQPSDGMQAGNAGDQMASPTQTDSPAQTDPAPAPTGNTQVFLLFGQSNMWGVPAPQAQDMTINPRVEVLTMTSCAKHGVNQWVPAQPPLHGCVGMPSNAATGPGVGPGDYFAKTIADAFPNDTILLVPGAVPSVSIDTFQPGQPNYDNLLARAKMAQQRGTIRGFLLHQGESDTGTANEATWPMRVKTVVDRLRSDLGVPQAPLVAGELWAGGCCGGHNRYVDQLPSVITNAGVAKSDGLNGLTKAQDTFGTYHFDLPSQRTLGQRYGQVMLQLLGQD